MLIPIEFFGPLPAVVMQMKMNDVLLQGLYKGSEFFRIASTGEIRMSDIESSFQMH